MVVLVPVLTALVASSGATLNAEERVPIAVVVNTPTGKAARTSRSEIIRIVDGLLRELTDYFALTIDEQVVEDCTGSLTCVALTTRRDYERETQSANKITFDQYQQRLQERGLVVPRQLLMISNVAGGERGDRLSVLLLDLDRALRLYHEAERRPGFEDEVEIAISEKALLAQSRPALVLDEAESKVVITRAFERQFEGALERLGHFKPYGTIALTANVAGVAVEVDGRAIGQLDTKSGTLRGVRPGRRTLTLRRAGYEVASHEVEVAARSTANADVTLVARAGSDAGVLSGAVLYGGAAVAAVGAALVVYGLTRPDGDVTSHCFAGSPDCGSRSDFVTFGYDSGADGVVNDVNPGGLLVVPLGYSLFATGATWSAGALTFDRGSELPWLSVVVGVVVGALSYGVSAAL